MDRTQILEKIQQVATEQFGREMEIQESTNFVSDLDADSLDLLTMVIGFEETFGMSIPDDRIESLATVKDVIDFIVESAADPGEGAQG